MSKYQPFVDSPILSPQFPYDAEVATQAVDYNDRKFAVNAANHSFLKSKPVTLAALIDSVGTINGKIVFFQSMRRLLERKEKGFVVARKKWLRVVNYRNFLNHS